MERDDVPVSLEPRRNVVNTIEDRVRDALATVTDPELPAVRIVDLGVVEDVRIEADSIEIDLLPTFSGCPALDIIRKDVVQAVTAVGEGRTVRAKFLNDRAWTTDRMSPAAHEALKDFGVSPPLLQIGVRCPFCGSPNTALESAFGPTPCRDIRYCNACRNPFEGFKPKVEMPTS